MTWVKQLYIFNTLAIFCMVIYGGMVFGGRDWLWNGVYFDTDTPGVGNYLILEEFLTMAIGIFCIEYAVMSYHLTQIEDTNKLKKVVYTNVFLWIGWTILDWYYFEYYTIQFKMNVIIKG